MGRWSEPSMPDSRTDTSVPLKSFLGEEEIEDGVWRNLVRGLACLTGPSSPDSECGGRCQFLGG